MPSDHEIAKGVAGIVLTAWSVVSKEGAARSAFMLYGSLLGLDDQEIEPGHESVTVRARSRAGIVVEAKGSTVVEAVERFLGRV